MEVPPDCPILADDVAWAFSGLEVVPAEVDVDGVLVSSPVELVTADDDSMLANYGLREGISSRIWRSVTPLALPEALRRRVDPAKRHEQTKDGTERLAEQRQACRQVAQALRHAGFRHRIANLRVQREPFEANGERAETFAEGTRFSKHQLWHVEIEFVQPVSGPLVLGSGRYLGLGLLAPVRKTEGVQAFGIVEGLTDQAEPTELARALRRAVMARVQHEIGKREELPVFFSGHESDGTAARSGAHAHLAFVPDLVRGRLLVLTPHVIEHRQPTWQERQYLEVLAQALEGMESLRAGRSGKLRLTPVVVNVESDPLFAGATIWVANTPYVATRHAKRNGKDSLHEDVLREIQRRGLPFPELFVNGSLTLKFAVAVSGPVLLGKNMHFGGGLFVGKPPK